MVTSAYSYAFPPETERSIADFAELVTAALANVDARDELATSRARIVEAADAARRRIQRDLHDGAQQRLVSLALSLRMLESSLEPGSEAARELAAARAELAQALEELRELARGIHPSVLTDRGLPAALRGLVRSSAVPVDLDVEGCPDLPIAVATTAYFLVAEALTNAIRHAGCGGIEIRLRVEDGWLDVGVRDDGAGGADLSAGSGLRGLADRVSALGGSFDLESEVGEGTAIRAQIPTRPSVLSPAEMSARVPAPLS
jgi:signal transduction histidine kinase